MSRAKNARDAQKRRRDLAKSTRLRIWSQPPLRTLKTSARKGIARERALKLQILPWLRDPAWRLEGCAYPGRATLLGLPPELRQRILYETCSVPNLRDELEAEHRRRKESVENYASIGKGAGMDFKQTSAQELRKLALSRCEGGLVALLGQKIGVLCCVAPQIRLDMQYVMRLWQRDLEEYMEQNHINKSTSRLLTAAEGDAWMFGSGIEAPKRKRKRRGEIEGEGYKVPGKRPRAFKCWYCMERHLDGDPVCPWKKRDPAMWQAMTKKVGGRRGLAQQTSSTGTKVVFDDN
ncbi:uncharacterized protein K460DRAFT_85628 [Cucurbitaria berberidis CBS 394.84]|uniref:Uncharacterized protein n=1 Tax=Cucurbitaria berberidis CBS 394.84 TaxID=1168544 RepID=A0A9P4GPV2_9PLEO|nr:uncharacterized protein K460DRAFT_85628 [Cucurbitaria berberidis CBS 394.84]KAF1849132.1 hypothetical protein K460DRAFT_85628 [Cucurbitaria berberidis CBS 394.84]